MIVGSIANRLALVALTVQGPEGLARVEFRLDTGYSGTITLPPDACKVLKLPFLHRQPARVAGGAQAILDVYLASLIWDEVERPMEVLAVSGPPLLGMAALEGSAVRMQVVEGGALIIDPSGADASTVSQQ